MAGVVKAAIQIRCAHVRRLDASKAVSTLQPQTVVICARSRGEDRHTTLPTLEQGYALRFDWIERVLAPHKPARPGPATGCQTSNRLRKRQRAASANSILLKKKELPLTAPFIQT